MSHSADMESGRRARIAHVGYEYNGREKELVTTCNLCGSRYHVEISRHDRYGFDARLRLCGDCGLGFVSPRLTASEYSYFYEAVYRPLVSAYHGRLIDAHTVQAEQREYAAGVLQFVRDTVDIAPGTVMDIGGSTGTVGAAFRRGFGASVTVLDPAPEELAVAEAQGMEVVRGVAEDFDPGERTWDFVLLCQTLDHLMDVAATLASIRRMMHGASYAYIDVVDLEFMLRRCGQIEEVVKVDHPYYVTRHTARAFFGQAGLDVEAERLSDEGEWGFLLRRSQPRELDLKRLRNAADDLVRTVWLRRAAAE